MPSAHPMLQRMHMPFALYRVRTAVPGLRLSSDADLARSVAEIIEDLLRAGKEATFERVCEELRATVEIRDRLLAV